MNKAELKKHLKDLKTKQKEEKIRYKATRPSFKERVKKIAKKIEFKQRISDFLVSSGVVDLAIRFNNARKKIGNKIHSKKVAINDLRKKVDYIVDSLKATLNTTDEIKTKTIEDIVENIDDL